MEYVTTKYQIGPFRFAIEKPKEMPIPTNMSLFERKDITPAHTYKLRLVEAVSVDEDQFLLDKNNMKVYVDDTQHKRYLFLQGDDRPYALCHKQINKHETDIDVDMHYLHMFSIDTIFGSTLSLEKRLFRYNSFVLHSAYLCHDGEAILFTAPSGGGKSTQAALWEQYRGARVINGDRSLLMKQDGIYHAYGWPICGSSGICHNEHYPIKAIVSVQKGQTNSIKKMDYKSSYKKIISELTINYHAPEFVNTALDFIDDLVRNVAMYELTCDISEEAVRCLAEQLAESKEKTQ